ncbi:MAG: MopE-related protein [Myxococcota bacterium]
MRNSIGLSALVLVSACGGGTIDLGDDFQRQCPGARFDGTELTYEDVLFTDDAVRSVTFTNGCRAKSGNLSVQFVIEGADGFQLSVDSLDIGPGDSADLQVYFAPEAYGAAVATLVGTTNDPDVPTIRVPLSGTVSIDQDGDDFTAVEAGGTDCDDRDPNIRPGVPEVWYDGIDQDCDGASDYDKDLDGYDRMPDGSDCNDDDALVFPGSVERDNLLDDDCDDLIDEDFISPNDLVVTEVMVDPVAVFDTDGEWFEVQNTSDRTLDLRGWTVTDFKGDSFVIGSSLVLARGERSVLGVQIDPVRNGGAAVDYQYNRDSFSLDNTADAIGIQVDGNTVTLLEYEPTWSIEPGASLSLDPLFVESSGATVRSFWCAATSRLDGGDGGTPGGLNDECTSVDHDGDGVSIDAGDCNDGDNTIYPNAPENWNGIDDDCDGIADNAAVARVRDGYLEGVGQEALSHWNSLSVGDVDDDGDLEFMVGTINRANTRDGVVYVLDAADADTWSDKTGSYADSTIEGSGTYNNQGLLSREQADVNGDGVMDLVIGGTSRLTNGGMAVAMYDGASGLSRTLETEDAQATWEGGFSIDTVRVMSQLDVNGDGLAEIVYSDPGLAVDTMYGAGAVYLIDADGAAGDYTLDDDHEVRWTGATFNEQLGSAMDGADFDNDGYDDMMICAQWADFSSVNGGGCALVMGTSDNPKGGEIDDVATATIGGRSFNERFGAVPTMGIGDFDGDTKLDVALSSPFISEVRVFFDIGSYEGAYDAADADVLISTRSGPTNLGMSVAAGDVDGDGQDDLLVGAPDTAYLSAFSADEEGRVWVWSGKTLASKVTLDDRDAYGWLEGQDVKGAFGWSILMADLDGDGQEDLIVGEPNYSTGNGIVSVLLLD